MVQPNAGYLFYKQNFTNDPGVMDHTVNKRIEGISELPDAAAYQLPFEDTLTIPLSTTYPGLVIGTGYTHAANSESEAFKIGFFFDHTTGMPVIPGTSVKGSLRSLFPNHYRWKEKRGAALAEWEAYAQLRYPFIRKLLSNICKLDPDKISNETINQLEEEIFAGLRKGKAIGVYQRDIFNDAFPVKIEGENRGREKRLFAQDNLTPHINRNRPELSPFTEPVPLKFLKVLSRVQYEFRFVLRDSQVIPELTADRKKVLFQTLLQFNGVGAKTAVGYGQFAGKENLQAIFGSTSDEDQEAMDPDLVPPIPKRTEPAIYNGRIRDGEGPIEAIVLVNDPPTRMVYINTKQAGIFEVPVTGNCREGVGELVKVVINQTDKRTKEIKQVGYRGPVIQ